MITNVTPEHFKQDLWELITGKYGKLKALETVAVLEVVKLELFQTFFKISPESQCTCGFDVEGWRELKGSPTAILHKGDQFYSLTGWVDTRFSGTPVASYRRYRTRRHKENCPDKH